MYSRIVEASFQVIARDANIMADYFTSTGDSFHNYMSGWCGPLTYAVSTWLKQRGVSHKRLLIVRGDDGKYLNPTAKYQPRVVRYHAIIVVDGMIHCPWLDERLTIEAYCAKMFPSQKVIIGENYSHFTIMEKMN